MRKGNIIAFKGRGFTFTILSFLLSIFDKEWRGEDWKPWHLAIAWARAYGGWYILEATGAGVKINFYDNKFLESNTRSWEWLGEKPDSDKMAQFLKEHILKRYDVAVYFWTIAQYLVRHYFHHSLPLVLNNRYSCWELVDEWCDEMGKPWAPKYGFPLITDFLKAVKQSP